MNRITGNSGLLLWQLKLYFFLFSIVFVVSIYHFVLQIPTTTAGAMKDELMVFRSTLWNQW